MIVIAGLPKEMGADPVEVLTGARLAAVMLDDPKNRIPYLALGRLLQGVRRENRAKITDRASGADQDQYVLVNDAQD